MLISLHGCTTTENDETIAVYDDPSATKLTNAEITNLVEGNVVSFTKWSGVASYYKNGSYQYSQGGKTYNQIAEEQNRNNILSMSMVETKIEKMNQFFESTRLLKKSFLWAVKM